MYIQLCLSSAGAFWSARSFQLKAETQRKFSFFPPFRNVDMRSALLAVAAALAVCVTGYGVADFRVEYLVNPMGLDVPNPRFSWKIYDQDRGTNVSVVCVVVRCGAVLCGL
jgi:hypothetical protein